MDKLMQEIRATAERLGIELSLSDEACSMEIESEVDYAFFTYGYTDLADEYVRRLVAFSIQ